jgi:2-oxo-4-hydroxy-4-carboxy-5-ureidoimidazoline decarboxylase
MISLDALNEGSADDFVEALSQIYEHGRWVAEAAVADRPFPSVAALATALRSAVAAAGEQAQMVLVAGHPDLADKTGGAGALTGESRSEQVGAGLDRLSEDELAEFHRLKDAYRSKFGYPFIICVRRHGRDSIFNSAEARLENEPDREFETALAEINRIAALRLADTVEGADMGVHGHLSTHVLDSHSGKPAKGIPVRLLELSSRSHPRLVAEAITNQDGRTGEPLIGGRPLPIARYELHFRIGAYFAERNVPLADPPFLDEIPIRFGIAVPEGRYHVPLLITPWSYSTYRGS